MLVMSASLWPPINAGAPPVMQRKKGKKLNYIHVLEAIQIIAILVRRQSYSNLNHACVKRIKSYVLPFGGIYVVGRKIYFTVQVTAKCKFGQELKVNESAQTHFGPQ